MRQGSPLVPLPERVAYLAGHPWTWSCAWSVWIICALALIAFLVVLAQQIPSSRGLANLAVMIALVGAAWDLCCDCIYILVFPWVASWQPLNERGFLLLEQVTAIASLVIANGLYSVAILVVTTVLRQSRQAGRLTVVLGYAVGGGGLALAASAFTANPWHAAAATGPTIGLFCVWVVLVARGLSPIRK
jgi:hypothetical protein